MDKKGLLFLLISCLCCVCSLVHASNLPDGIEQCTMADAKCLLNRMNFVMKRLARTGSKKLGLVKLDPLHIKKFSLGKNPNSPVSIDLTFTDADLLGLADAEVKKVTPFTKDLSRDITFEMFSPKISLTGPYKVDGKVLILPIQGEGKANIVLDNCKVIAVVKLQAVSKGPHQTFAQVNQVLLKMVPSRVHYELSNLFNGQEAPSKSFHTLVNQNSLEIWNELHGDIAHATGLIFKSILNKMLGKRPLEELFADG